MVLTNRFAVRTNEQNTTDGIGKEHWQVESYVALVLPTLAKKQSVGEHASLFSAVRVLCPYSYV